MNYLRETNTLNRCYKVFKAANCAVPHAALGFSDHYLLHLIVIYRQKLKTSVRKWTDESKQILQACFDCKDCSVFTASATDLNELTKTVTYIRICKFKCVDQII